MKPKGILEPTRSVGHLRRWQPRSGLRHYARCQLLGAAWCQRRTAAILRVPSSIIGHEHNYVLNTRHPDFGQVRIVRWEDFEFDPRIKDA